MRARLTLTLLGGLAALAVGYALGRSAQRASEYRPPEVPVPPVTGVISAPPQAKGTTAAQFRWAQLESPDYLTYVANLRRIGCSEQTIRDIIIADICHLYSQEWKRKHLATKPHYWDPGYGMGPIQSEELQGAAAKVQATLRQNVRDLLGADLDRELEKFRSFGATPLGDDFLLSDVLTPEKATAVSGVLQKQRALRQSVESAGFLTAEGVATLGRARDEARRELQTFLSAEELAQVEYRCSETAQEIRDRMAGFDLSESEFRELLARRTRGQEQFEASVEQGAGGQSLTPDEILSRVAETELGEADIREALGPERHAEYERSQDARYQQLKSAAAQSDLSPDWARLLYDNQRAAEENARTISENPGLSAEQKEALLDQSRQQRQEQVRLWLGEELARKLQSTLSPIP